MDYMEDFAGIDIHDLLSRVEDPHFLAVRFCLTLGIFNTMSWKRQLRGMIAEDSINHYMHFILSHSQMVMNFYVEMKDVVLHCLELIQKGSGLTS